jgi:hypothetical protein
MNLKCSCGSFSTDIGGCTDCEKKICSDCIVVENSCTKCFSGKKKEIENLKER